jgi:hypothetical protein
LKKPKGNPNQIKFRRDGDLLPKMDRCEFAVVDVIEPPPRQYGIM